MAQDSFVVLTSKILKLDKPIPCDIFVHLLSGKAIKIMKAGDKLAKSDVERLAKYPGKRVLIRKSDYAGIMKSTKDEFKAKIQAGKEVNQDIKDDLVAYAFNINPEDTAEKKVEEVFKNSKEIVSTLLTNQQNFNFDLLLNILNNMEKEVDPFKKHAAQVSSISMMIAQIIPNIDLENINEIGLGAAIHSMGLQFLENPALADVDHSLFDVSKVNLELDHIDPKFVASVIKKHFNGHMGMSKTDNQLYIRHLDFIKDIPMAPKFRHLFGLKKTLDDFRTLQEPVTGYAQKVKPYISSKILVIGDRLLGHLKSIQPGETVTDLLDLMRKENLDPNKYIQYDLKILEQFQKIL